MTQHLSPEGEAWINWLNLAAEAAADLRNRAKRRDSPLLVDVERHLLVAELSSRQAATVRLHGWFDLPWPEQHLVLRVNTRRFPTVDAYQPPPALPPATAGSPPVATDTTVAPASRRRFAASTATYLCSFDVRSIERSSDGKVQFERFSPTPAG